MPKQIDLPSHEYRLRGSRRLKVMSSRPFRWLATLAGIWAGGFWYTFTHWIYFAAGWIVLVCALLPGVILFFTWIALGGEDSTEPAEPPDSTHRNQ